jgi:hypothetical protein
VDVIALAGNLRYREHRSVPEIHRELTRRGVAICERSVLLERYDELVAASAGTAAHRETLERQGRVILAIFSPMLATRCYPRLPVRAGPAGPGAAVVGLRRSRRPAARGRGRPRRPGRRQRRPAVDPARHRQGLARCPAPVFHYLREATLPVYEARAKKELKKTVRGVRPIERKVEDRTDEEARVVQGYCAAIRGALTDDGPLEACGCMTGWRRSRPAGSSKRGAPASGVEEALLAKGLERTL